MVIRVLVVVRFGLAIQTQVEVDRNHNEFPTGGDCFKLALQTEPLQDPPMLALTHRIPPRVLMILILVLNLASQVRPAAAELIFREDWAETPASLPIDHTHVAHPALKLELHGPGLRGIKKSHHDNIENDPFYVWSGKCEKPWALSLIHRRSLADLSAPEAKVRWRSRQSGAGHELRLILRLPGDRWIIGDAADGVSKDWRDFEITPGALEWRKFNIITITAGEAVPAPNLKRVDAIGFTDLAAGGGSKACSRLDWIEVHGEAVERPARKPPAVKMSRVPPKLSEGLVEHSGLTYAQYGEREIKLDLYAPEDPGERLPAVIFIHGGGWYKGTPASYTAMAMQLAARGFVTANIEYRLAGEAPFPAAIHDCKAAVRWLRANAEKYNIDPTRIGAVGGSAGGHLSGLLATSGTVEKLAGDGGNPDRSSAIQAAVIMAGPMDLTTPDALERAKTDPRQRAVTFMGGTWELKKQTYIDASPNLHISAKTPPLCFMDGEFDQPGKRYIETKKRLDALKIPHESHVIEKAPHPFWSSHPFFQPALEKVAAFFESHLSPGAEK